MEELMDKDLWIVIRAGLLEIVNAYKQHGSRTPLEIAIVSGLKAIVAGIERRYQLKKR